MEPEKPPAFEKPPEPDKPAMTVGAKILYFLDQSKYILAVSSLIGLLFSIAVWIVEKRHYHIVAWKQSDQAIYPSDLTNDLSLPLSIDSTLAKTASLIFLDITNYGNRHLGTEGELWQIHLSAPESEQLTVVGKLETKPRPLVASILPKTKSNAITIDLGILEPDDHVRLHLLLINDKTPGYSSLTVTSNFKSVLIESTSASPTDRIANKIYLPTSIAVFLVMLFFALKERRAKKKLNDPKVLAIWAVILWSIFMTLFLGYALVWGIAWIILLIT